MARIIGGSMIGELSGKMGGIIFSRNKSGPYMKQYVIPIDPRSQAQIEARASFGIAAANWHILTSALKVAWQSFAQNNFLPKIGANTGQFSGFNAWTALNNTVINAKSKMYVPGTGDITITTNFGAVTPTELREFNTLIEPPVTNPTGAFFATGGGSAPMTVLDAEIFDDFKWTLTLNATGGLGVTPGVTHGMEDSVGNPSGFACYMSNPVKQEQDFINNEYMVHLGTIQPAVQFDGVGADPDLWIKFACVVPKITEADYQGLPVLGDWVRLSFFQVIPSGQMLKIGAKTVQIAI